MSETIESDLLIRAREYLNNHDVGALGDDLEAPLFMIMESLEATTERLRPDVKEKWVEALRHGRYKQGEGNLRAQFAGESAYCCLGILCHLVDPNGWEGEGIKNGILSHHGRQTLPTDQVYTQCVDGPDEVVAFNIAHDQHPPLRRALDTLAEINDSGGEFWLIAHIIEDLF